MQINYFVCLIYINRYFLHYYLNLFSRNFFRVREQFSLRPSVSAISFRLLFSRAAQIKVCPVQTSA